MYHAQLLQLRFDVGLLHVAEERGGRDPLGGAVRRALHHVYDHLRLVVGQCFDPLHVDSEGLVSSQQLM
uniref:Uncharacterized protein n=1 Tax=Anguilla anguilla TaxID=7936 RepID=A0A0E9UCE8_ANGAN